MGYRSEPDDLSAYRALGGSYYIRGAAPRFTTNWAVGNSVHGTSLAGVPSPWTGSAGAQLCNRWINGHETTTPLWPWPMNDRIKWATQVAGSYPGPCLNCSGGRAPRTQVDVQAQVENLLGSIPSQCRANLVSGRGGSTMSCRPGRKLGRTTLPCLLRWPTRSVSPRCCGEPSRDRTEDPRSSASQSVGVGNLRCHESH